MAGKITFMIIRRSGYTVNRISISKSLAAGAGIFLFIGMLTVIGLTVSYARIRSDSRIQDMTSTMNKCRNEIAAQEKQIDAFREGVSSLNEKILALVEYEGQLREITNIKKLPSEDSLFGVGSTQNETGSGSDESSADDVNEALSLDEKNQNPADSIAATVDPETKISVSGRNILSSTPTIMPLQGEVVSAKGNDLFQHGILFSSQKIENIAATADGVVSYVGRKGHYGLLMIVDHGHGFSTRYGCLDQALKNVGDTVTRGEIIARTTGAESAKDTTASAYYEVRLNGITVNPLRYVIN